MRGESYNFAEVVKAAKARLEKRFVEAGKEALVEGTDWSYEEEFGLLTEEVKSVADQCRKDETKKMVNVIEVGSILFSEMFSSLIVSTAELQEAGLGARRAFPQQTITRHVGQRPHSLPKYS